MVRFVVALSLLSCVIAPIQKPAVADPFDRLAFLIGKWEGTSDGQPGTGTVRREYSRALNGRFIRVQNRSEYAAQPKNPKGEIHEDEGFFSFAKARNRVVFRQFHTEGFVNTYIEDAESSATKIMFVSEAIENIPVGFRARETYLVQGTDAFEEVFELAEPDKRFEMYSEPGSAASKGDEPVFI
jgi:THAP4-like, heme-binding beta-barrel domain